VKGFEYYTALLPWDTALERLGIPKGLVVDDGSTVEQTWRLRELEDGAGWEVAWIERGGPSGEVYHAEDEEGARHLLIGRLLYSQMLAKHL
jgi:hypothetical protein